MKTFILLAFVSLFSLCSAQYDPPFLSNEWYRENARKTEEMRQRRMQAEKNAAVDSRLAQLEDHQDDALYEYRSPTRQEVAAMEKEWNAGHPFTFSGEMPEFKNQQIRVLRADSGQLERTIAAQEQAIANAPQPPRSADGSVMMPGARRLLAIDQADAQRAAQAAALARDRAELVEAQKQAAAQTQALAADQAQLDADKHALRQAEYDHAVNLARDRIFAAYPILAKGRSIERLALDAYVTQALKDPARQAEFRDPNWPAKLAVQFAKTYGIKSVAQLRD